MKPSILFVTGSLRRESYNTRLLEHLARSVPPACRVEHLRPCDVALPLFDQDLEQDACLVERVARVHARICSSDALVVATPEYNGQPTAYLKNLVDWVSRLAWIDGRFADAFRGRPLLLCSASTGQGGGAGGLAPARALFGYVGSLVLGETVCMPMAHQCWTGHGYDLDPALDARCQHSLAHLMVLAGDHARRRLPASELA